LPPAEGTVRLKVAVAKLSLNYSRKLHWGPPSCSQTLCSSSTVQQHSDSFHDEPCRSLTPERLLCKVSGLNHISATSGVTYTGTRGATSLSSWTEGWTEVDWRNGARALLVGMCRWQSNSDPSVNEPNEQFNQNLAGVCANRDSYDAFL
jgi:hypothetical protein